MKNAFFAAITACTLAGSGCSNIKSDMCCALGGKERTITLDDGRILVEPCDRKNGTYTQYDHDGRIDLTIEVKDGVKHGISTSYYPDGTRESTIEFDHGVERDKTRYSRDGIIIYTTKVENEIKVK